MAKKGSLYSLLFSDNGLRSAVAKKIQRAADGPLTMITRLTPTEINRAFVEGNVRTLWLSGTHRRTTIKPDSKILSGLELETSLDPLGDQTYYFSSVRSTMALSEQMTGSVVGASPSGSRIWIGPTKSWIDFTATINLILDRAGNYIDDEARSSRPLPILASSIISIDGVREPYDIALIVPERVSDNFEPDGDRWIHQFMDAARFEITSFPGIANFEADVFWAESRIGRLAIQFEQMSEEVRLKVQKVDGFDSEDRDAEIFQICRQPENLTIYFDTGHTYSRGHFYETQFRDARFENWRWVSMATDGTAIDREKPLDGKRFAIESVGGLADTSLFGMVVRHWPNLETRGEQRGWLVCDDGAMESADFIHIDDESAPPILTLIHVKGSGSNGPVRGISVSDYEVVVSQAVKNLRHVDRGLLKNKLAANAHGVLEDAVWHNGQRQVDRAGVLAVLDALGTNYQVNVVVFQPNVRQDALNAVRSDDATDKEVRRMQQLDALLLAARADCFSLGADFRVIADGPVS